VSDSKLPLPKPRLTSHPVDVGQRTEAIILGELVRRGYRLLVPFGVNQRYDLVVDLEQGFVRAQCKTGRLHQGVVRFPTRSIRTNRKRVIKRGYVGDADVFMVYCPENGQIYSVPVEAAPADCMHLRVKPPLNGQVRGIRWAKNFELPG
jgi:PD-(D/E)XK endonuclease